MTLLPEEETLNSRLGALEAAINSSSFKVKFLHYFTIIQINIFYSQNRLSALSEGVKSLEDSDKEPQRYKMDPSVVSDIKQVSLKNQTNF